MGSKSHIQLSQLLMRGFCMHTKDGEKVLYLDLQDNVIKTEKVKELDAEFGYFEEDVEKYLANVEAIFGDIIKNYKRFRKKEPSIIITPKDIKIIKLFMDLLILRNEKFAQISMKSSFTISLYGNSPSGVIRWYDGDGEEGILKGYYPTLLANETNVDFVLIRNAFYVTIYKEEYSYILPINPRMAIVMLPKKLFDEYYDGEILEYGIVDSGKTLKELNNLAYHTEKEINNKFIIGSEAELQRLQELNKAKNNRNTN